MITFVDKKNIEEISARISRDFAEIVKNAVQQAIDHGAVRLHETSTHFFAENPKRVCAFIVNNLTNKGNKFASVSTICKNLVYKANISINNIITVWHAPADVINRIHDANNIFKPKYYLMVVYRELYNPALIDNFIENQKLVKSIHKKNLQALSSSTKSGGGYDQLYKILNTEVFIGKKAFNFLLEEPMEKIPFEIISDNVSKTLLKLKSLTKSHKTEEFVIFTDFKFSRTTVKLESGELIIYNSGEYELIPFINADVRIGAVYVITRFILINIFISRIIEKTKKNNAYLMEMHDKLIAKDFGDAYYIPPVTNYYGIAQKEKNLMINCDRDIDYKPLQVKKKLGKLLYF